MPWLPCWMIVNFNYCIYIFLKTTLMATCLITKVSYRCRNIIFKTYLRVICLITNIFINNVFEVANVHIHVMKLELYQKLIILWFNCIKNGSSNNVQFIYLKLQMMFTSKDSSFITKNWETFNPNSTTWRHWDNGIVMELWNCICPTYSSSINHNLTYYLLMPFWINITRTNWFDPMYTSWINWNCSFTINLVVLQLMIFIYSKKWWKIRLFKIWNRRTLPMLWFP